MNLPVRQNLAHCERQDQHLCRDQRDARFRSSTSIIPAVNPGQCVCERNHEQTAAASLIEQDELAAGWGCELQLERRASCALDAGTTCNSLSLRTATPNSNNPPALNQSRRSRKPSQMTAAPSAAQPTVIQTLEN